MQYRDDPIPLRERNSKRLTRTWRSPTHAYFARAGSREGLMAMGDIRYWNVLTIDFEFLKGLSWSRSPDLQRCFAWKEMDSAQYSAEVQRA